MNETERWVYGIVVLFCTALVLFLLIVLLNAGTILTGMFLVIIQIAITAVGVIVSLGISLWVLLLVFQGIANSETRIQNSLKAVHNTLQRATQKLGADFLSLISGLLIFLIQESISDYEQHYKISISVMFTLNFFLASQLIGSTSSVQRILGIFFFLAPVVSFFLAFLLLVPQDKISAWIMARSESEIILLSLVLLSCLLTFTFAFFKNRDVQ